MDYNVDFGFWGSIFAVPTALVDRHLKLCSETQLKTLLLALRDAPNPIDVHYIAKRLGATPSDVSDALDYWNTTGIFTQNTAAALSAPQPAAPQASSAAASAQPEPPATKSEVKEGQNGQRITTVHARCKLPPNEINRLCDEDKQLPWLIEQLQQLLSRPLSPAEVETTVYLYTYLRLTPDYLLIAVEYCRSIGKANMHYIEKMITGWVDSGIDSYDKAEQHIVELGRRATNEGKIRSMFGISDRTLTPTEKKFINIWFTDYGFDTEIIQLAFERTVDSTGKIAFPYLNKILSKWHEDGITSVEQATQESSSRAKKQRGKEETSFDLSEIERVMKKNTAVEEVTA